MKKILALPAKIKRHVLSIYISFFIKKDNQEFFESTAKSSAQTYSQRKDSYDYNEFLMPSWKKNTQEIEAIFMNGLPFSFLRNQMLKHTMFAHLPKAATVIQKNLITQTHGEDTALQLLHENNTGKPILNDIQYRTSGNSIHHLYHLTKFGKETGVDVSSLSSVLEFGGGYGNAAHIFKKINPGATYTIVDIPIFSYIQFVYLSTVLGTDQVVMFDQTNQIIEGKINIVPLHKGYIDKLNGALDKPDLFISTWALSETNEATQQMVRSANYFNCTHLLLAYQKANDMFAFAQDIEKLPDDYSPIYQAETEYLGNNFYLFAQKN